MLRRRFHDALGRALRLSCTSKLTPTVKIGEKIITHRCQGIVGHRGMHGDGTACWNTVIDDSTSPADRTVLRLSEVNAALKTVTATNRDMAHLLLALAQTSDDCAQLRTVLAGEWDDDARARALELHKVWADSVEHLMTCVGLHAHGETV